MATRSSLPQQGITTYPSNFSTTSSSSRSHSHAVCPHCSQRIKSRESQGNAFQTSLQKYFPGAYGLEDFIFRTKQALVSRGFYPRINTLACVGLCRDEITSPFKEEIEAMWGQAFICSSLGGMLFCGKTGFGAAHHHAASNGYFIYYCFTHIAIDHEGLIGNVYRTRSGMNDKNNSMRSTRSLYCRNCFE